MIREQLDLLQIQYKTDESLAKYSTFRVGGTGDLVVFPGSEEEIKTVISICNAAAMPYLVVGNGSNILFPDEGYRGVILHFGELFSGISPRTENTFEVKCGTPLSAICRFAAENSLQGLAFAYGIPGSLGGAVYMNAGAYGGEMSQVISSCTCMKEDGSIVTIGKDELEFSYRHSIFQEHKWVVLSAVFHLEKGDQSEIFDEMKDHIEARTSKQPLELPSCGSTFKRPEKGYASQLIDQCGLRGLSVGGAMVSTKHCGFIVNTGNATSNDIKSLIRQVSDIVWKEKGIRLVPEVEIVINQ